MKKCNYCGEEIQDKAKKCRYCGEWINEEESNNIEEKNINNKQKSENYNSKDEAIDLIDPQYNINKKYKSNNKLILGIILSLSLIIIFIISAIINWVGSIMESTLFLDISSYVTGFLYFISIIFLTPFGIYLLASNRDNNINENINKNINDIEYVGFWERLGAHFIDTFLAYLIIPLFFNLYYWFKDGQTIGYKILGVKTFSLDGNKIKSASGLQLFFYPFLKILNIFTLYIGFIMVGITKKKQGLHNIINNTVVVRVDKKNNTGIIVGVLIFLVLFILPILGTIAFISLQGYSEDAKKAVEMEQQNSNAVFNINNGLFINNSNKLISEEFDKVTLKQLNDEADKGFLTNNGNYVLFIPEKLDKETAEIYADDKNNNQNKLGLKSVVLGMGGKNIISEIKNISGSNFYIFSYEIEEEGDTYHYYAIFGGKNLDFENIYLWGENKEKVKEDGEFLIKNLEVKG